MAVSSKGLEEAKLSRSKVKSLQKQAKQRDLPKA